MEKVAEHQQFPLILETVKDKLLFIFLVRMKHFPSEEIAMGMTTVESQLSVVNYAKGMTSLI